MYSLIALLIFQPSPGQATLPIAELLELKKTVDAPKVLPPVQASLESLTLEGRFVSGALEVTARASSVNLAEGWTTTTLIELQPDVHPMRLERTDQGTFVRTPSALSFASKAEGRHDLTFGFVVDATRTGDRRRAAFSIGPASMARLELALDGATQKLLTPGSLENGVIVLRPTQDSFVVEWEESISPSETVITRRAPIDPSAEAAFVQVVLTPEGRELVRARYTLRVEAEYALELRMPEGRRVTKLAVNGASRNVPGSEAVAVSIAPERLGDRGATVEVLFERIVGPLHLSGRHEIELPALNLPVERLDVEVYLPSVMSFQWAGGSLSPAETVVAPSFTIALPTPGKRLGFRQDLVFDERPYLKLDYAVDLTGAYYR